MPTTSEVNYKDTRKHMKLRKNKEFMDLDSVAKWTPDSFGANRMPIHRARADALAHPLHLPTYLSYSRLT